MEGTDKITCLEKKKENQPVYLSLAPGCAMQWENKGPD